MPGGSNGSHYETIRESPVFERRVLRSDTLSLSSMGETLGCQDGQPATSERIAKTTPAGAPIVALTRMIAGRIR